MKILIIKILCVSVFFMGLGGIIQQVAATFKSDERTFALLRQTHIATGGGAKINSVKSFTIIRKAPKRMMIDGIKEEEETVKSDVENNLLLPNQFDKIVILPRMKSRVSLEKGEELPRTVDENVLILEGKKGEDCKILKSGKGE